MENPTTELRTSWDTGTLSHLMVTTAWGWMSLNISMWAYLMRMPSLMTFIPPAVEPVEPPTSMRKSSVIWAAAGHRV